MILSSHFTLDELTASEVAARRGIDNTPSAEVLENLKTLAARLERVRTFLGTPIIVTSGYRSPKLNTAIGGSKTSAHMRGLAADFIAPSFGSPKDVFEALLPFIGSLSLDQLILEYDRWVHLGLADEMPRQQALMFDGKSYTRVA